MTKPYSPPTLRLSQSSAFDHHGAAILLLIRERTVTDWKSLCRLFGFKLKPMHSGHFALQGTLKRLIDAELLESSNGILGPYRILPRLNEIQDALGFSLVEAANLLRFEGMAVRPKFGARPQPSASPHIFVLMPFATEFRPVYKAIQDVGRRLGLRVQRADDIQSSGPIFDDVWRGISNAALLVADCTGQNPNVFYELGIAHTLGRDVILLTQSLESIPFDVRHIRHIAYRRNASGILSLKRKLESFIRSSQARGWNE